MKAVISTVFLVPRVVSSAFAADSAVVYQSGILVSVFVNVFALIVVVLLVPALFMLVRFIEVSVESVRQRVVVSSHTYPVCAGFIKAPVATEKRPQWLNLRRMGVSCGKKDLQWIIR